MKYLKAGVKKGETVLMHGASGAVGLAALQLAKHLGECCGIAHITVLPLF